MAFGDPQYQLNALTKRVTQLETLAKASPAKAVPYAPLTAATSSGGTVGGLGVGQDTVSRATNTAIQAALSGAEALQYVQTQLSSFNLGAVTSGTIRQEFLRPYPVVGQVYRATIGGNVVRSAGAAFTITIFVDITGGTSANLLQITPAPSATFLLQVMLVTTTAGTSAIMQVNSVGSFGPGPFPIVATTQLNDSLLGGTISGNLAPGSIDFSFTTTALSAGASLSIDCYILESLGFRTG